MTTEEFIVYVQKKYSEAVERMIDSLDGDMRDTGCVAEHAEARAVLNYFNVLMAITVEHGVSDENKVDDILGVSSRAIYEFATERTNSVRREIMRVVSDHAHDIKHHAENIEAKENN